jgi:putative molybdopterin biosynthesis protein
MLGISPDDIRGYEQEEFTHMAVAVNILSGRADAGMAIFASAKALGLDFIPVAEECYDLVIPDETWADPKIDLLRSIIDSASFRSVVTSMGGYDVSESGRLVGAWDGEKWANP